MTSRAICRRLLLVQCHRTFTCTGVRHDKHYPLVVLGGGSGGCAVAARACRALGPGKVAVVEPAKYHFYQPMWTLVGAGIQAVESTQNLMADVLPKSCAHIKQRVQGFDPDNNTVELDNGDKLTYDFLVVALGIQLDFNKVEGLIEALKSDPSVCTNYLRNTVEKTFPAIQACKEGEALFTFPNTPIKCAGAPQKIMYLAEEYWRKHGVRDRINVQYLTAPPVIFGVPKYAETLRQICDNRNITVNYRHSLKSIDHTKKEAVFDLLDSDGETVTKKYDFIHVGPPQSGPDVMKNSTSQIVDATGFLDVNKETTQHVKYENIFGLGDCSNIPTSKTAAAVASQHKILFHGLLKAMAGQKPDGKYDGYTSCPLITGYNKCVLAEFDFNGVPMETFPFNQGKERRTMFYVKKLVMPEIYWRMMLKGSWSGPKYIRKLMHLGMSR